MIKNVAFHKDKVIIIDDKDSVTVMRVYEKTNKIKKGEYVVGIVHVDSKKTTNWFHIYDNSLKALKDIAKELNVSMTTFMIRLNELKLYSIYKGNPS